METYVDAAHRITLDRLGERAVECALLHDENKLFKAENSRLKEELAGLQGEVTRVLQLEVLTKRVVVLKEWGLQMAQALHARNGSRFFQRHEPASFECCEDGLCPGYRAVLSTQDAPTEVKTAQRGDHQQCALGAEHTTHWWEAPGQVWVECPGYVPPDD